MGSHRNELYRARGYRITMTRTQLRITDMIRRSQRDVYNWCVNRLLADSTIALYDLQKEFTIYHNDTPWLQDAPIPYQGPPYADGRRYIQDGNGSLKYRSAKRDGSQAV